MGVAMDLNRATIDLSLDASSMGLHGAAKAMDHRHYW